MKSKHRYKIVHKKTNEKIITEMCLTYNHSYGMDDKTDNSLTSGMTKMDKERLYSMMSQIYDHHIEPIASENNKLKEGIKQEAAYSQKWADEHAGTDRGLRHQERADRLMELLK